MKKNISSIIQTVLRCVPVGLSVGALVLLVMDAMDMRGLLTLNIIAVVILSIAGIQANK